MGGPLELDLAVGGFSPLPCSWNVLCAVPQATNAQLEAETQVRKLEEQRLEGFTVIHLGASRQGVQAGL